MNSTLTIQSACGVAGNSKSALEHMARSCVDFKTKRGQKRLEVIRNTDPETAGKFIILYTKFA